MKIPFKVKIPHASKILKQRIEFIKERHQNHDQLRQI